MRASLSLADRAVGCILCVRWTSYNTLLLSAQAV